MLTSSSLMSVLNVDNFDLKWKEKRVFYMTPQTLNNDLVSENCDAKDIVLLVIGMSCSR